MYILNTYNACPSQTGEGEKGSALKEEKERESIFHEG